MRPLEPEIIPPGRKLPPRDRPKFRVLLEVGNGRQVPIGKPGLVAAGIGIGVVVLALAATLVTLGAVFLVWLPTLLLIGLGVAVLRWLGLGRPRRG